MFYRLTPHLVLRSPWRPYLPKPGERVWVVQAPRVFPPGHPTTRLCLDVLKETLGMRPCPRFLEVGCGSGVLTLAAAGLGAPFCVGVDINRQAARISRNNARRNGLEGAVRVVQGSTECLKGPFEVILANLPWGVQMDKVAELTRLAAPGGCLILSGFKDTQEEELWRGYRSAGWRRPRRVTRDEWVIELPPEKSFTWVAWGLERER